MNEAAILKRLRKEVFLTACMGGGGHLASSFSSMEILYALYGRKALGFRADQPLWPERDMFILSKGHAALALYVNLANAGFFTADTLQSYCQPGSPLGGEPCGPEIPGVEAPTGSLGHGLSFGVGTALGSRLTGSSSKTFVLLGDGECEEGAVWEAATTASALKLDRLTAIIDVNGLQKMDYVSQIAGPCAWSDRWKTFGWQVVEVDGHDVDSIYTAVTTPHEEGKPLAIIARTIKGKGVSLMENVAKWHYRMPSKKETKTFMSELDISEEELNNAKSVYQRTL